MSEEGRKALTTLNEKREDEMKKIFLKGMDPKIKQELWPRLNPKSTFKEMTDAAVVAETIVMKKEGESKPNEDLIAVIVSKESEQKQQLEKTQKEIDELKTQISFLIGKIGEFKLDKRGRSRSRDRVHFKTQSKSPRRFSEGNSKPAFRNDFSRSRSRSQGRTPYHSRSRSRDNSLDFSRDRNYRSDSRDFSRDRSRNYSKERPPSNEKTYDKNPKKLENRTCYNCKNQGHIVRECPYLRKRN